MTDSLATSREQEQLDSSRARRGEGLQRLDTAKVNEMNVRYSTATLHGCVQHRTALKRFSLVLLPCNIPQSAGSAIARGGGIKYKQ